MKQINDKRRRVVLIVSTVVAVGVLTALFLYKYATLAYGGDPVRVYIPRGTTPVALADTLRSRLGETYGGRVMTIWEKAGGEKTLSAGSYLVSPGEEAWKLARRIKNRRQDPVKLTFNNVRTMTSLADVVDSQLEMSADEFLAATDEILSERGVAQSAYPSFFLPDTYEFYWTESPENTVERIIAYHDGFWNDERLAKAKSLGLSPEEVSTVASIVEEETNKADERPQVARLYLNRLKKGMKLQADPTVKFAVGDFSLKRILGAHLAVNSPYNTYVYKGLPPGPIRLPAASTIDAVLNAPVHDYIYMCAKEDFSGYHNFAADYAAHQANARRYRAALDARGIK